MADLVWRGSPMFVRWAAICAQMAFCGWETGVVEVRALGDLAVRLLLCPPSGEGGLSHPGHRGLLSRGPA
jgi:hypothetical protein